MVTVMDTTSGTPAGHYMTLPWDLVGLGPLMTSGLGCAEVRVGLIDGPVVTDHPDLAAEMIRALPGRQASVRCEAPPPAFTARSSQES